MGRRRPTPIASGRRAASGCVAERLYVGCVAVALRRTATHRDPTPRRALPHGRVRPERLGRPTRGRRPRVSVARTDVRTPKLQERAEGPYCPALFTPKLQT